MKLTHNMPCADYYRIDALNWSRLRAALHSPAHFANYDALRTETPEMRLGTLVHQLILEPDADCILLPKCDRRTKAGKAAYAEAESASESSGLPLVREEEMEQAKLVADAVMRCSAAREILERCSTEVVAEFDLHGRACKARLDLYDGGLVADLKTTSAGRAADGTGVHEYDEFARTVSRMQYHGQAAFYVSAVGADEFAWLVVETEYPYVTSVRYASRETLDRGAELVDAAFAAIEAASFTGNWSADRGHGPDVYI